jgi:nitrate reductase gamma subunit
MFKATMNCARRLIVMSEVIYYVVFPYVAVIVAVVVGLYRYFTDRFSYSSMSSQFLENRALFWGSVPWHYGIIMVLFMHLFAAVIPDFFVLLHRDLSLTLIFEMAGLTISVFTFVGLILLLIRRIANSRIRAVTSIMDWALMAALLLQVAAGVYIAFFYRWGMLWYIYTASPWLSSLVAFDPRFDIISPLPWIVRFHAVNAFVVIALFPFTRLVHIFTVPISYLWRPYQVVMWNRRAAKE